MLVRWWKRRRRRKLIAQPFPASWDEVLQQNVWLYGRLTEPEQASVRQYLQVFIAEKHWEGCRGFHITDAVRVTIAAQVAILVLGIGTEYFDQILSILVYPDAYVAPDTTITRAGVVLEGGSAREGEAWYRGPVILSWEDVLAGSRDETWGENLVLHEFAHQLDMLNGHSADGIPPMNSSEQYDRWTRVMSKQFRRLVQDCERGQRIVLDCYGATSRSEFFAVATEGFFHRPQALRQHLPDLYEVLREFYKQDPVSRG